MEPKAIIDSLDYTSLDSTSLDSTSLDSTSLDSTSLTLIRPNASYLAFTSLNLPYYQIINNPGMFRYLLPYLGKCKAKDLFQLAYCHILSKYIKIDHFFIDLNKYFIEFIDLYFILIFNYSPKYNFPNIEIKYFYLSSEYTKLFFKIILDLFSDLDHTYISSYLQEITQNLLSLYISDSSLCINNKLIIFQEIIDNLFVYDLITDLHYPYYKSFININYKAYSPIRHAWITSVIRITIMRNKRK
jgi:hypothetical protein